MAVAEVEGVSAGLSAGLPLVSSPPPTLAVGTAGTTTSPGFPLMGVASVVDPAPSS